MKQSILFTKTQKRSPKDEKSTNAILLQRAGFVHKEMAGVYSFLVLGLRVLKKIEQIIREEMEAIAGQEVVMSVLQPKEIWQKTGRWSKGIGKEIIYKCRQGRKQVGLGPTHEEMLTNIVKDYIKSYEDLPMYIFQIQTKFRKEARAKSGLLRGREFGMKDLYSFHADEKDFWRYYEKVKQAYFNIFKRCGLEAVLTEASGGDFTEKFTHEFQVLAENGEDIIFYCPKLHFSRNKDVADFKKGAKCPICKFELEQASAIEVGNIFPLGNKFSQALDVLYQDSQGRKKPVVMGSYGIGTGRLMGAIVEVFNDKHGIVWPESVAPFDAHLLELKSGKQEIDQKIKKACQQIYKELNKKNIELLYDDRDAKSAGEKLVDADLIGIPYRIVISERTMKKDSGEVKKRDEKKCMMVRREEIVRFLKSQISNNK